MRVALISSRGAGEGAWLTRRVQGDNRRDCLGANKVRPPALALIFLTSHSDWVVAEVGGGYGVSSPLFGLYLDCECSNPGSVRVNNNLPHAGGKRVNLFESVVWFLFEEQGIKPLSTAET